MATPITPPEWATALSDGAYQRALRLLRTAVGTTLPNTNDLLIYVLQAVGRFAEADALMTQRAELERELGPSACRRRYARHSKPLTVTTMLSALSTN